MLEGCQKDIDIVDAQWMTIANVNTFGRIYKAIDTMSPDYCEMVKAMPGLSEKFTDRETGSETAIIGDDFGRCHHSANCQQRS